MRLFASREVHEAIAYAASEGQALQTTVRVTYQVLERDGCRVVVDHEIESVLCALARAVQQGVCREPYDVPGKCRIDGVEPLAKHGVKFVFSSRVNADEFAKSVRMSFGRRTLSMEILRG